MVGASALMLLAAVIGVGTQLHSMSATPPANATGTECGGQKAPQESAASCFSGNDLLANSISRAVSVALQPTASSGQLSNQVAHTNQLPNTIGQPCHDSTMFVPNITVWTVPPGCYATIYTPDRSQYSAPSTFGYCNWWVEALHPKQQDILYGKEYVRTTSPVVGAAIWFPPNVQGASSAGHWAQVVAIAPDHYWMLITEMNFGWRGGGFGKVDYRYAHVDPAAGIVFVH
ncbi:MAG TPA: hypothetical protein VF040_18745 [Ktedonobacterales bacterium]